MQIGIAAHEAMLFLGFALKPDQESAGYLVAG